MSVFLNIFLKQIFLPTLIQNKNLGLIEFIPGFALLGYFIYSQNNEKHVSALKCAFEFYL